MDGSVSRNQLVHNCLIFNLIKMKKIIIGIAALFSIQAFAQVVINADAATALTGPSSTSVLLEFGKDNNKGIILPYVESLPTGAVAGTFIFDVTSNTEYKVKIKDAASGWIDFSTRSGYTTNVAAAVLDPQAPPVTEATAAKTIIGSATSPADGILVLESTNKAMVLPKVTDVQNIPSPSPGMMVFVTGTQTDGSGERFAVYNGKFWSFWKP